MGAYTYRYIIYVYIYIKDTYLNTIELQTQ